MTVLMPEVVDQIQRKCLSAWTLGPAAAAGMALGEHGRGGGLHLAAEHAGGADGGFEPQRPPGLATCVGLCEFDHARWLCARPGGMSPDLPASEREPDDAPTAAHSRGASP